MNGSARTPIADICFPERRFGGFSRIDGTVAFYARVRALLPADGVALDIGCGRASWLDAKGDFRRSLQIMQGHCAKVIGIDVDPAAADNPTLDEFRLIENPVRWPMDDASIDLAISDFVLEHLEHPSAFFAELKRVIKPGGYVCMRTPNKWSYVALAARLIPERMHKRTLKAAQPDRKAQDVFPAFYRANSKRTIERLLREHGFDAAVIRHESEPSYLGFSRLAYRFGVIAHKFMPPVMRTALFAFGRKL